MFTGLLNSYICDFSTVSESRSWLPTGINQKKDYPKNALFSNLFHSCALESNLWVSANIVFSLSRVSSWSLQFINPFFLFVQLPKEIHGHRSNKTKSPWLFGAINPAKQDQQHVIVCHCSASHELLVALLIVFFIYLFIYFFCNC